MNFRATYWLLLCLLAGNQTVYAQDIPLDSLPSIKDTLVVDPAVDSIVVAVDTLVHQRRDTVVIVGVGDIMMGTNYPDDSRLPPDNGRFLMKAVEPYLTAADLLMGNLEGVLLDSGGTVKSCKDPKVCYAFRSPVSYVNNLVSAGFDVLSLANNHAGDFGNQGRESSMKTLEAVGIYHAGQLSQPFVTFTKDSIRYGFLAVAPNSGCVPLNDVDNAVSIIHHLDSISDIVIVSFHGGAEGSAHQHVPRKQEIFYGENRGDVYSLTRAWIDAGADIVFGHGPHVTRAVDLYRGRFIAYSMGNFCTYRGINIAGVNGLAPIVRVLTKPDGEFISGEIIPTFQSFDYGVRVDPENRVIRVMQDLTKKDFPESEIGIDDNGLIFYLNP